MIASVPPTRRHTQSTLPSNIYKMAEPASKRQRFDFTETITVCAGEEAKEFIIHKNVITTSSSKFFNKVLSNDWKEARERRINLPEIQVHTLEVYLHWMYSGHLVVEPRAGESVSLQCVKLYILGDYLDDASFCEVVVERLVDRTGKPENVIPDVTAVTFTWERKSATSPLRSVIRELWMSCRIGVAVKALRAMSYPPDFVLDILEGLVSNNPKLCEDSFSGKTSEQLKKICKGYVKANSSGD